MLLVPLRDGALWEIFRSLGNVALKRIVRPGFLPFPLFCVHAINWIKFLYHATSFLDIGTKAMGHIDCGLKLPKLCAKINLSSLKADYLKYLLQWWKADYHTLVPYQETSVGIYDTIGSTDVFYGWKRSPWAWKWRIFSCALTRAWSQNDLRSSPRDFLDLGPWPVTHWAHSSSFHGHGGEDSFSASFFQWTPHK
jgi:hypothetical protein